MVLELNISDTVICLGSLLFLMAAFSPVSRVFGVSTAEKQLAIINGSLRGWRLSQALFAAGALITALGVGLLAFSLRWLSMPVLYLPAVLLLVGALAWSTHVYLRAVDPQAFVAGALPAWHFRLYTWLTLAGFFLLGYQMIALFGVAAWQAWFLMGASLVIAILYLAFRDMPPFVYYLLALVLGVSMILSV
jgi:hypothetical protein